MNINDCVDSKMKSLSSFRKLNGDQKLPSYQNDKKHNKMIMNLYSKSPDDA